MTHTKPTQPNTTRMVRQLTYDSSGVTISVVSVAEA